jgi:hypothetical protein
MSSQTTQFAKVLGRGDVLAVAFGARVAHSAAPRAEGLPGWVVGLLFLLRVPGVGPGPDSLERIEAIAAKPR